MVPSGGSHFRFGTFEADPASGEFWKNGRRIRLQEQPFRLLVLLLENAGSVVTREELQKRLWPSDTFVEFDYGLNTAIKKLRQALGDSADNPRFIQTLPRKGYRFIAPVRGAEAAAPVARSRPWRWRTVLAAAVCVVAAAATSVWLLRPRRVSTAVPVPFLSYPGIVGQPSFSPDGRSVAFSWNGENEDNTDVYVKQIGTETPVRLTIDPALDGNPAWSPDGRLIAFRRTLNDTRTDILIMPAAGGPEVRVTETVTPFSVPRPLLAWSPDSKWLVVTDTDTTKTGQLPELRQAFPGVSRRSLFLVSTETGERRRLTSQPDGPVVDGGPAFSPDGRTLAFVRYVTPYVGDLYLLPLSRAWAPAGVPKRLTAENRACTSPAWTPDGASVVFAYGGLRIAARRNGEVRRLEFAANNASNVVISRQGTLVYSQSMGRYQIWRVALSGPGVIDGVAKQFLGSTRDLNPQFSADGRRIVFASSRGGSREIWIANADGTNLVALTSMHASLTGGPNWSPDGSHIAFDSTKEGQFEVYTIGAAGGTPRRLTDNPATDGVPSWSRDGAWIYFMSNRSGEPQVWKMPAAGGQPVQVTKKGGYVAVESPDGRFVYYSKSSTADTGLWRLPVSGGEESEVLPSVTHMNFAIAKDGIYFIPKADEQGRYAVHFFSFATRKSLPIAPLGRRYSNGLAVSPDGKILLYSQPDTGSFEWMMVDHFR
jgi:Tol biopolymer transport system component/DNA-binding winged helix-turn-helix (wHTH) protein